MSILYFLFLIFAVSARKLTEEEYSRLPNLYQLDDYEKCLSRKDGLYCVGTFHFTPETQPHVMYDLIKEYAKERRNFNRTLIHRGYCVSARCPSAERNTSLRFERCAAQWGHKRALRTTLHTPHYCRTHKESHNIRHPDIWQNLFNYTIYIILAFNILGTIYDFSTGGNFENKNFFVFWSVRSNWNRLVASYADGDPLLNALAPLNGGRVLSIIMITWFHCGIFYYFTFVHNPHALEQFLDDPANVMKLSSASGNQLLIIASSFLTCYNLLLQSKKYRLSLKVLPIFILKRITRIAPVYYLVIFYVLTWWPLANDGPLWQIFVIDQSNLCRRKFWSHIFFVNNIVQKNEHCLIPTWFLAADMHMCIVAMILTIWIVQQRRYVVPILATLYIAITIIIGVMAYVNSWSAPLHKYSAEYLRMQFQTDESFIVLHISSWAALAPCLLGVMMAYVQYQTTIKGFNPDDHKWLACYQYLALPILFTWFYLGVYIKEYTSPLAAALYITVERPFFCFNVIFLYLALFNIDGPFRRFWSWRGFQVLARMSLPALLICWILNVSLMASKAQPISPSHLDMNVESFGLLSLSFLLALPLTILVEMPMGRFLGDLLARNIGIEKVTTNKIVHVD